MPWNLELITKAPTELHEPLERPLRPAGASSFSLLLTRILQLPIPNTPRPQITSDLRRIILCPVIYKVVAKHLLEPLDSYVGVLPSIPCSFLSGQGNNRPYFCHTLFSGRVVKVREQTQALDLSKAFGAVSHASIVAALQKFKVSSSFISLVHIAILWFGQCTVFHRKGRGVKQVCPIFPRPFTLVVHARGRLMVHAPTLSSTHKRAYYSSMTQWAHYRSAWPSVPIVDRLRYVSSFLGASL